MSLKQGFTRLLGLTNSAQSTHAILRGVCGLLIGLTVLTGQQKAYAGEPGTYQAQGLRLIQVIHTIHIKHGRCTDPQKDCVTKRIAFFGRSSSGINVEIFNASDPRLIQDVFSACLEEFELNQRKMDITLSIYSQPHEEMMGFTKFYKEPSIRTFFKGN